MSLHIYYHYIQLINLLIQQLWSNEPGKTECVNVFMHACAGQMSKTTVDTFPYATLPPILD